MSIRPSNRTIAIAVILIIVGLLIAIVPWYILPVCEAADQNSDSMKDMKAGSKGGMIMKCGYTARAEVGVGLLGVLLGLSLLVFPRRDSRRAIGVQTIGVGVVAVLLPTVLIGVCGTPSAPCVIGTKPGLILLGTITVIIGLVLLFTRYSGDGPDAR